MNLFLMDQIFFCNIRNFPTKIFSIMLNPLSYQIY